MKLIRLSAAASMIAALAGCASGPQPMGRDTYIMTDTGTWSWSSGGALKAGLFKDATQFCESKGKEMMPVSSEQNNGSFRDWAHAEVQFRCLDAKDPELKRPTQKPAPKTIEVSIK